MDALLQNIRRCQLCTDLPMGANPVVQLHNRSKIIIIGQAPGRKVHQTGIPWNDPSGDKLRYWLGVSKEVFYDPKNFSIMAMGFCYPGKGSSGDLPPRKQCATTWHSQIHRNFDNDPLIILIGQYAQNHYLKTDFKAGLTETVRNYRNFLPRYFVLPHPSPRNQNWLKINPWFGESVLEELRKLVRKRLDEV